LTVEGAAAFIAGENDDTGFAAAIATQLGVQLPEIEVADFRRSGYLPHVLTNYIALLGWNPGGDVERFDHALIIDRFGFDRVGKANSTFDREKLFRFNADTIAAMQPDAFVKALREHFDRRHPQFVAKLGEQRFAVFARTYQPRTRTLDEPAQLGRFFIDPDESIRYDNLDKNAQKALEKNDNEGLKLLAAFREELAKITPEQWSGQAAHDAMTAFCEQRGAGMGKVAQPIRVAVSGGTVTPGIDQTLEILGRDATLRRIDNCLAALR
jgi:glutamyl-tRNA synthetase